MRRVPPLQPVLPTTHDGSPRGGLGEFVRGFADMGNRESSQSERKRSAEVPRITVVGASPLPADGSMFNMPGPAHTQTPARGVEWDSDAPHDQRGVDVVTAGSLHRPPTAGPESDEEGAATPKASRQHFLEVMISSSPQVRRSLVLRNSVYLSTHSEDSHSDGDSVSLVSSLEEDRSAVTLDPLEHEWMMCASDGAWDRLYSLLAVEPGLALKKDFVTGFTCLHWAAKLGKPDLIALIINFAKQNFLPINVNVRSSNGYTPLHVAAMHDHVDVLKLLVGAYNADVDIRDYSGRKACQYVSSSVGVRVDVQDIIGTHEHSNTQDPDPDSRDADRWRFSKVLQPNRRSPKLHHEEGDTVDAEDRPRQKPARSKSSLGGMRPRLHRIRWRTSQIVHRASFHETQEQEDSPLKSRPRSHFFWRKKT